MAHAIETHGLTRRFDDRIAVEALSLTIEAGTVFGFLGPNGAGKTTTVRMLAALIAPTDGDAIVAGHVLGVDDTALRGRRDPDRAPVLTTALGTAEPALLRAPSIRARTSRCAV